MWDITLSVLQQNCLQGQMKTRYERRLEGMKDHTARITLNDILAHLLPKTHEKSNILPIPPSQLQISYNYNHYSSEKSKENRDCHLLHSNIIFPLLIFVCKISYSACINNRNYINWVNSAYHTPKSCLHFLALSPLKNFDQFFFFSPTQMASFISSWKHHRKGKDISQEDKSFYHTGGHSTENYHLLIDNCHSYSRNDIAMKANIYFRQIVF